MDFAIPLVPVTVTRPALLPQIFDLTGIPAPTVVMDSLMAPGIFNENYKMSKLLIINN